MARRRRARVAVQRTRCWRLATLGCPLTSSGPTVPLAAADHGGAGITGRAGFRGYGQGSPRLQFDELVVAAGAGRPDADATAAEEAAEGAAEDAQKYADSA